MTAKWALVTGGNRGLGLEICKQLVAAGKPVLLTARNTEQGAWVVSPAPACGSFRRSLAPMPAKHETYNAL
jgi:NAD(P)-dependent dehydrogenase (short-subunit alcohol dehydrogenase family)